MSRDLVSVVIPCYNHEKYIAQCIQSVFNQTYKNIEIVIVDDGSKDSSVQRIEDLIKTNTDRRIRLFKQKNKGAHHALNYGLKKARGTYISILNSDDMYAPSRIETLVSPLRQEDKLLAFSGVEFIDENDNPINGLDGKCLWYHNDLSRRHLYANIIFAAFHGVYVSSGNFIFHRRLLKKVKGFRDYRFCHDLDFFLRVAQEDLPIFVFNKLYKYRVHNTNTINPWTAEYYYEVLNIFSEALNAGFEHEAKIGLHYPSPYNYPLFFRHFFSNVRTLLNGEALVKNISLATTPLLKKGGGFYSTQNIELLFNIKAKKDLTLVLSPYAVLHNLSAYSFEKGESRVVKLDFKLLRHLPVISSLQERVGDILEVDVSGLSELKQKSFHIGAFYNNKLIGCRLLHRQKSRGRHQIFIVSQNSDIDYGKIKFNLIRRIAANRWQIWKSSVTDIKKERQSVFGKTGPWGCIDKYVANHRGELEIVGWCLRNGRVPRSLYLESSDGEKVIPSLGERRDLGHLVKDQFELQRVGFSFKLMQGQSNYKSLVAEWDDGIQINWSLDSVAREL